MARISNLIPRAAWEAKHPDGFGDRPMPVSEWWLHHSVTVTPDLEPPFYDDDAAVRTLENIGQARFGGGISYTVLITPTGRAYEGHGIGRRGAHTYGHNTVGAAICLVGNYETHDPTARQVEAAAQTLVLSRREGLATRHTLNGGHRDAPINAAGDTFATACPGGRAYKTGMPAINARAEELWAGGFGRVPSAPSRTVKRVVRKVTRAVLVVDGVMGPATIRQWQKVMGTPIDGVISTGRGGSSLISAVQRRVGVKADGFLGPITWRAIQRRLGVTADGVPGPITIKALQRRLNAGQF